MNKKKEDGNKENLQRKVLGNETVCRKAIEGSNISRSNLPEKKQYQVQKDVMEREEWSKNLKGKRKGRYTRELKKGKD